MLGFTPRRLLELALTTLLAIVLAFSIAIGFGYFLSITASAHDAEHEELDGWYSSLTQPDAPEISCCGKADAYWADSFEVTKDGDYVAIITDERDVPYRPKIEVGTKIVIPKNKIKWDQGNPTGHGILFALEYEGAPGQFMVYCYLPPGGV